MSEIGSSDLGSQVSGPPKDSMDPSDGFAGLGSGSEGPEGSGGAGSP